MQRHRLTHLRWHLKATAQLTSQLRARIVGRLHPSPRQDAREWQRQIEQVLAQQRRLEEEAALAGLGEYAARGVLTTGLAGVLEVVNCFSPDGFS